MRYVRRAIGVSSILVCGVLATRGISVEQSVAAKPTPLILAANDGERREFRTRPGVTFMVKVDPKNGGSEHMAVVTEDMAPGDRIPVHRHPHADELILIQSVTGRVTLGDKVQEVHAGGMVFIPSDTWIGMKNIGPLNACGYLVGARVRGIHASHFGPGWQSHQPTIKS